MPYGAEGSKINAATLFFLELVKISIIAGLTISFVRYFLFKPFYVEGASMEPNFQEHEYLIIDELSYRFHQPRRGDTVVFRYPLNPAMHYLKRVIALPGDRIKIEDGVITLFNKANTEGKIFDQSFIKGVETKGSIDLTLKEDEFFMMGDNRDNSYDSRRFGPVKKDLIVGRVLLRGWPFQRFGLIANPALGI
mgnify:CR=1 FL=1